MTDFSQVYDEFLALIDNEADKAEVRGHLAVMSKSSADSPEFQTSQRQMVRMLKSRASNVLPRSWRDHAALEEGKIPGRLDEQDDLQLRTAWKEEMESVGVFNFGEVPTWDDIDSYMDSESAEALTKHYGTKGWWRKPGPDERGVKPPHAPRQEPHGNEVGVRHMVVRLRALPKYRGNPEKLNEKLDLPGDTSLRASVAPDKVNDDAFREKLEAEFRQEFAGKLDEAVEGTGRAGENFKLSATRGRGRRADEHQDPTVQAAAADRAASDLWEGLAEGIDGANNAAVRAYEEIKDYKTTRGIRNVLDKYMRRAAAARGKFTRLDNSGASTEELVRAAMEMHDRHDEFLVMLSVAREQIAANPQLMDGAQADKNTPDFIERHLANSAALSGAGRAFEFSSRHDQGRDAAPHERPWGPDEGVDDFSQYIVELNEIRAIIRDLREGAPKLDAPRRRTEDGGIAPRERRDEDRDFRRGGERDEAKPAKEPRRLQPAADEADTPAEEQDRTPEPAADAGEVEQSDVRRWADLTEDERQFREEALQPILDDLGMEFQSDRAKRKVIEADDWGGMTQSKIEDRLGEGDITDNLRDKPDSGSSAQTPDVPEPTADAPEGGDVDLPDVPRDPFKGVGASSVRSLRDGDKDLEEWRKALTDKVMDGDAQPSEATQKWGELLDEIRNARRQGGGELDKAEKVLDLLEKFHEELLGGTDASKKWLADAAAEVESKRKDLAGQGGVKGGKKFDDPFKKGGGNVGKRLPFSKARLPMAEDDPMKDEAGPIALRRGKPKRLGM